MLQAHSKGTAPAQWDTTGCALQWNPSLHCNVWEDWDWIFTQKSHFSEWKRPSPVNYGPPRAVHQSHREQPNEGISRTVWRSVQTQSPLVDSAHLTQQFLSVFFSYKILHWPKVSVMWFTPEKLMKRGTPCHLSTTGNRIQHLDISNPTLVT